MTTSRAARMGRGAIAGAVATFVAGFFHVLGGGEAPASLGVAITLLAAMWVSVLLVGRALSLWRLIAPVAISQLLFHTLFTFSAAPSVTGSGTHAHHHDSIALALTAPSAGTSLTLHAFTGGPAMWASHAVAVAVTVALLYRGERMLQGLATLAERAIAWFRIRLDLAPAPTAVRSLPQLAVPSGAIWVPQRAELAPLLRRGPPLLGF